MKNICKLCGTEFEGTTCPVCGTETEIVGMKSNREIKKKRSKKPLVLSLGLILLAAGVLGYRHIPLHMEENSQVDSENEIKESVQRVINLIDSIEEQDDNTLDDLLKQIQSEYNALTKEDKSYVSNYDDYKDAYDKNIAKEFDEKVLSVVITTYSETVGIVNSLRVEYNDMTENQKQGVKNLEYLDTYEARLDELKAEEAEELAEAEAKKAEAEKIASLWEVVNNFREFNGKWGDFGAHINSYQGEIESAIKASIDLSDYFQGAPNDLTMWASSFTYTYGGDISSAWTYVTFEGILTTGEEGWLSGEIVVQNGEFVYTGIWTSQDLQ